MAIWMDERGILVDRKWESINKFSKVWESMTDEEKSFFLFDHKLSVNGNNEYYGTYEFFSVMSSLLLHSSYVSYENGDYENGEPSLCKENLDWIVENCRKNIENFTANEISEYLNKWENYSDKEKEYLINTPYFGKPSDYPNDIYFIDFLKLWEGYSDEKKEYLINQPHVDSWQEIISNDSNAGNLYNEGSDRPWYYGIGLVIFLLIFIFYMTFG